MPLAMGRIGATRINLSAAWSRRGRLRGRSDRAALIRRQIRACEWLRTPVRWSRPPTRRRSRAPPPVLIKLVADLLYFDSRTRIFKLFLDFRRFFLVDAFLDRLRRRLDKVLGFLEAELVIARTSLITLTFFSPIAARITSNSVFSAAASAAGAAPPAAPPPRPAPRPRRPTSLPASSPAPPPRSRSAPTDRRRALPDQPCCCSRLRA